jgi:hypothetical protein
VDAAEGYKTFRRFLDDAETLRWRKALLSRAGSFQRVARKGGMNLPYHVMDGIQIRKELPELFELAEGRLRTTLEETFGRPLTLLRDPKRCVRIQWYRSSEEGLLWHLDGGAYSALLTFENSNGGGTDVLPMWLSRYLKPVPYIFFPFPGLLERAPSTELISEAGDLLAMNGGALIHRGKNPRDAGERMVLVASYDPPDRRPSVVWERFARWLNY